MKHGGVGQHQHTFEFNLKAPSDAACVLRTPLLLGQWLSGLASD